MSKDLVTKKDADEARAKLSELYTLLNEARVRAKEIESFTARKLVQACLIPMSLLLDYAAEQVRRKYRE